MFQLLIDAGRGMALDLSYTPSGKPIKLQCRSVLAQPSSEKYRLRSRPEHTERPTIGQRAERGFGALRPKWDVFSRPSLSSGIRELVERGEAVKRSQEPKGMDEAKETSVFRLQLDQCTHELQDRGSMHRIGTG